MLKPERVQLTDGLEISRLITGLWQVADQEREDQLDHELATEAVCKYARAGFDTFDMADHYGSAELIVGDAKRRSSDVDIRILTKWCPEPGAMTRDIVRRGIGERLDRLGVTCIDMLQFHWWNFEHPGYIDAMDELARAQSDGLIKQLGVTNVNSNHLHLLAKEGYPIATNQVCASLLDRRALGEMSAVCSANGIKLLAYGVLAGGFLSERWLGTAEPDDRTITDWSKKKYKRFIEATGGWSVFQHLLRKVARIAERHKVSVANVATRWILDQPTVAAVIIGARLSEREHREDNLRTCTLTLDEADRDELAGAMGRMTRIQGDCGDEYRKPPFLTASGDLSHHLTQDGHFLPVRPSSVRPDRLQVHSGVVWENLCGYSRAVRVGQRILVSGTTATHGGGRVICRGDPRGQAVYILDRISAALSALDGCLDEVVLTRIYLANVEHCESVSLVHGEYFEAGRPVNVLVEVSHLVGDYLVEIEAEAVVGEY